MTEIEKGSSEKKEITRREADKMVQDIINDLTQNVFEPQGFSIKRMPRIKKKKVKTSFGKLILNEIVKDKYEIKKKDKSFTSCPFKTNPQ